MSGGFPLAELHIACSRNVVVGRALDHRSEGGRRLLPRTSRLGRQEPAHRADRGLSLFTLRGQEVGAAYTMQPDERQLGIPPHWNLYVTVASVDEAAKRAEGLGAKVLVPPFDVMDAGRMAVVQDPTGAVFQLWQAARSIGAKILNEPGALCWSELTTRDTKAAESFYTALFGWKAKHSAPGAPMAYTEFSVQDQPSIGMMAMPTQMPASVPRTGCPTSRWPIATPRPPGPASSARN